MKMNRTLGLLAGLWALAAMSTVISYRSMAQDEPPPAEDTRKPDPSPVIPAKGTIPSTLVPNQLNDFFSPYVFVMDKSRRTLSVWQRKGKSIEWTASVPADFGRSTGDKQSSGDHRTPEGIYFFQELKQGRELNFDEYGERAFTMDYPNFFDRQEGKSGNGIWLHAVPDAKSLWRGSRGCVVVRNEVIKELSQYISLKRTPIIVQDEVIYQPLKDAELARAHWADWLETWRLAWQSKDIDTYIRRYGDSFKALGMNKAQWRRYKHDLNKKYSFIKVNFTPPEVLIHGDEVILRTLQTYESDQNRDFGEKTLYLKKVAGEFVILSEEWRAVERSGLAANYSAQAPDAGTSSLKN